MKIELFTLCNFAANNNGKLTIVDTIDSFVADKFPWRAYFGIALKLKLDSEVKESGDDNRFAMYLCKEGESERMFTAETMLDTVKDDKVVLAANIKGLIFKSAGIYHFYLKLGETILEDYTFEVKENQ